MIIMGVTFLYLFAVTFIPITQTGNEHAKTIVGFLLGIAFSTLVNYYWGNSKKDNPNPEFPEMDAAIQAGTDKLQETFVQAVKKDDSNDS